MHRSKKEEKPLEEMVIGPETAYGKNGDEVGNGRQRKDMNGEKMWRTPRITKGCRASKEEEGYKRKTKTGLYGTWFVNVLKLQLDKTR